MCQRTFQLKSKKMEGGKGRFQRKGNAEAKIGANEDSMLWRGGGGGEINLLNWRVVVLFGPCSWIQSADR